MRKKEGNKELAIYNAAIKIFAEAGYNEAKVAKIAEVANVATGSVYVYYKDKEDILLKIFAAIWARLYMELKLIAANNSINSIEKFDCLIDLIFNILSENQNLALVFVNEQTHIIQKRPNDFTEDYENFFQLGEAIVMDGINNGFFNPGLNVKILRDFLFGGLRHILRIWASDQHKIELNEIRSTVKNLMKHGLLK